MKRNYFAIILYNIKNDSPCNRLYDYFNLWSIFDVVRSTYNCYTRDVISFKLKIKYIFTIMSVIVGYGKGTWSYDSWPTCVRKKKKNEKKIIKEKKIINKNTNYHSSRTLNDDELIAERSAVIEPMKSFVKTFSLLFFFFLIITNDVARNIQNFVGRWLRKNDKKERKKQINKQINQKEKNK